MIITGCSSIDRLLGGGLQNKIITQFYGPSSTGKTNICLSTLAMLKGSKKVAFIDTEGGFSETRLKQIAGEHHQKVLENTILFEPTSFQEQSRIINKLQDIEGIELIIIDSIGALYRLELSQEKYQETNRELSKQLAIVLSYARKNNIPVLMTNQVYTDINTGTIESIGGDVVRYNAKVIVELKKQGDIARKAKLRKHLFKKEGMEAEFLIVEKGLVE